MFVVVACVEAVFDVFVYFQGPGLILNLSSMRTSLFGQLTVWTAAARAQVQEIQPFFLRRRAMYERST